MVAPAFGGKAALSRRPGRTVSSDPVTMPRSLANKVAARPAGIIPVGRPAAVNQKSHIRQPFTSGFCRGADCIDVGPVPVLAVTLEDGRSGHKRPRAGRHNI